MEQLCFGMIYLHTLQSMYCWCHLRRPTQLGLEKTMDQIAKICKL